MAWQKSIKLSTTKKAFCVCVKYSRVYIYSLPFLYAWLFNEAIKMNILLLLAVSNRPWKKPSHDYRQKSWAPLMRLKVAAILCVRWWRVIKPLCDFLDMAVVKRLAKLVLATKLGCCVVPWKFKLHYGMKHLFYQLFCLCFVKFSRRNRKQKSWMMTDITI